MGAGVRAGFPGGSVVKNLPAVQETWRHRFNPWVRKIPWRRKWQPAPVFLPGQCHEQRSLAGYSAWGGQALDSAEHAHTQLEAALEAVSVLTLRQMGWLSWTALSSGRFPSVFWGSILHLSWGQDWFWEEASHTTGLKSLGSDSTEADPPGPTKSFSSIWESKEMLSAHRRCLPRETAHHSISGGAVPRGWQRNQEYTVGVGQWLQ